MKTLLVASDLHLSDRIWKHLEIEDDSYYSWQQIVELAIINKVDGVLLAGDILDKQVNQAKPVAKLLEGLSELTKHKIPVFFNQGQHEYQVQPWMLVNTNLDVTWLHENQIDFDGWKIVGCDYQNDENFKKFLKSTLALSADVLVCHQVWQDFMGENAKPQASFADVPKSVRCLITGDYHEHIITKFNEMIVLSPGSTHIRSLAEPQNKEVFLLKFENDALKANNLILRTRRLFEFKATSDALENLIANADKSLLEAKAYADDNEMPVSLQKPLFRIIHAVDDTKTVRTFKTRFEDKVHLFFKPMIATVEKETELPKLNAGNQTSLLSCLDTFIDKKEKPKAYNLALALLSGPEPEQALKRWVEEQTNV